MTRNDICYHTLILVYVCYQPARDLALLTIDVDVSADLGSERSIISGYSRFPLLPDAMAPLLFAFCVLI